MLASDTQVITPSYENYNGMGYVAPVTYNPNTVKNPFDELEYHPTPLKPVPI